MTPAEWMAQASKRDRLLVWQDEEPIDLPLPRDPVARAEIREACNREFARARS